MLTLSHAEKQAHDERIAAGSYITLKDLDTLFAIGCGLLCLCIDFTHILQDYFTGTETILRLPSANEATLGEWIVWIYQELII